VGNKNTCRANQGLMLWFKKYFRQKIGVFLQNSHRIIRFLEKRQFLAKNSRIM
jgi:hypothetical protein